MTRFRCLWVMILSGTMLATIPRLANAEDGWTPLFNGKDLSGWQTHPRQPGKWQVERGMLVSRGPGISHLFSERSDFENFRQAVIAVGARRITFLTA
jgi:hypothetical protein